MDFSLTNEQDLLPVDSERLEALARRIVEDAGRTKGMLSLVVVDDATIRPLNAQFLDHDYATDVLSFALSDDGERLEGEVIVSAETAISSAPAYGWSPASELALYVAHGVLHLVGYRDKSDEDVAQMRAAERRYLTHFGIEPPADAVTAAGGDLSDDFSNDVGTGADPS